MRLNVLCLLCLVWLVQVSAGYAQPANKRSIPGFDPQRHMAVDQVRAGMTGYALSVFHGIKIEPVPVEVVSVAYGDTPGKAVIWVNCPGERMGSLGPVSGMSGSPVFLWSDQTPAASRVPGRGGRMIGALAFGYNWTRDQQCPFGVQPIEQMLQAAARAPAVEPASRTGGSGGAPLLGRLLRCASEDTDGRPMTATGMWRLHALGELMSVQVQSDRVRQTDVTVDQIKPLALPLCVPRAADATHLRRLLSPDSRLVPVASGGSKIPAWLKPAQVKLEPGSVLAVPMVSGDMDWPAIGTVTEVLADGTVLGFGHAMFGQGAVSLPMAPGYVHFVMPSRVNSFKVGGSMPMTGMLVNDESTAIIGKSGKKARMVPCHVKVSWPQSSKNQTYDYQLTDWPEYLPMLVGYMPAMSMVSDTSLPQYRTLEVQADLDFGDGRMLKIKEWIPQGDMYSVVYMLAGPTAALLENRFGRLPLRSASVRVRVIEKVQWVSIDAGRLEKRKLKPGEQVVVNLKLRPFRQAPIHRRAVIEIPKDIQPGEYEVYITGGQQYFQLLAKHQPYHTHVQNMTDLFESVKFLAEVRTRGLYTILVRHDQKGTSIGRQAMPRLPSGMAHVLHDSSITEVGQFVPLEHRVIDMDYVVGGILKYRIEVEQP